MSAGKLTNAGRDLFAAKQGASQVLVIDRFMLANIPGLDPNTPVNLDETIPAVGDQVATLAVTQAGYVNADKVVYSLFMGTTVGDFTFNWVGLLADDDTLVAVRYIDPITKYATSGQDLGNAITRNFLVTYTDAQAITNVTVEAASWQWQFDQATELVAGVAPIATQTDTDTGTDDTKFITSLKLKNWVKQATESVLGMLKVATQAQTDTGTDDTTAVTPKKLKAWVKQATESVLGMLKVATQAQTDTGTDDTTAVTPKKLRWGFAASLSTSGYLAFPSWLGGVVIQWGTITAANNTAASWPTTFPNNYWAAAACDSTANPANASYAHIVSLGSPSASGFTFGIRLHDGTASSGSAWYIAIGN